MISALNKLPDGTIELTITIPWQKVRVAYEQTLNQFASEMEIKGFRKGKAPLKIVEQNVDKNKVYEEALKKLIPQVYVEAVKEHKAKPIINPEIKILKLEEGKDWQIQAVTCELPEIKLGDYQAEVRKALAVEKIWTPGKAKETPAAVSQEGKTGQIFKALLENVKFELPKILIDHEVNQMLSRLIDQTSQVGLTIEQYLTSVKKTNEQLQNEYRKQAQQTLRLEFILAKIADEEKIIISDAEIEKMIAAVPDEKTKEGLKSPQQQEYIKQILRKRKIIDNLLKL